MPAPGSTDAEATEAERLDLLATGDLVVEGRMPWSSNATFLCQLWPAGAAPTEPLGLVTPDDGDHERDDDDGPEPPARAIYKPHRGERPLWDFPDGLYRREVAAYHLARAMGWDLVPATVVRDGPLGPGSLQWFVDADFAQHHFTLVADPTHHPQLRRLCAFDVVANSTDRKAGHVLVDGDRRLWAIDNGLCLHAEWKLRTVIWDFADEPLPDDVADALDRLLVAGPPDAVCEVLDPFERDALGARARALLAEGRFPVDDTGHRVPWPLV